MKLGIASGWRRFRREQTYSVTLPDEPRLVWFCLSRPKILQKGAKLEVADPRDQKSPNWAEMYIGRRLGLFEGGCEGYWCELCWQDYLAVGTSRDKYLAKVVFRSSFPDTMQFLNVKKTPFLRKIQRFVIGNKQNPATNRRICKKSTPKPARSGSAVAPTP